MVHEVNGPDEKHHKANEDAVQPEIPHEWGSDQAGTFIAIALCCAKESLEDGGFQNYHVQRHASIASCMDMRPHMCAEEPFSANNSTPASIMCVCCHLLGQNCCACRIWCLLGLSCST